jgi:CRISPR type III-associated protein (TIGR04423 family)
MKTAYQLIKIEKIPDYDFEGYYWFSNANQPIVKHQGGIDQSIFKPMPFIIEANFYARKEKISIQVKNIDGRYHVAQIDLNNLDNNKCDKQDYIAHDLGDIQSFRMIEAWEEEKENNLLEGMTTLVPTWAAFAGFNH